MDLAKVNNLNFIILLVFLLFITFCSEKKQVSWIAKVGDVVISEKEYQTRLNFSSFLKELKNEENIKKVVLSSLLAEKILAEEAINNNFQSDLLDILVNQNHKELMIEYVRKDSVDSQVDVTIDEIMLEFKRKTSVLDVKYITIADIATASKLKKQIKSGHSFEKVAAAYIDQMGWTGQGIPVKKITWYPDQPDMEFDLYNLAEGSTSDPISAFGEYYLVKIDNIYPIEDPVHSNLEKSMSELRKEILDRKISQKYKTFYREKILPKLGEVNWKIIDKVVEDIQIKSFPENQTVKQNSLPDNNYFNSLEVLKTEKAVQFKNYNWTVEQLFQNLRVGPYVFDLENNKNLKKSLVYNINLLLEHEAWYDIANELEYEQDTRVQEDHSVWKHYYYATYLQQKIRQENEPDYINQSDLFVSKLSEKYKIAINKNLYNKAKFYGHNILLQKQHFSNRRAIPPLLAVGDYSQWKTKINTLWENELLN